MTRSSGPSRRRVSSRRAPQLRIVIFDEHAGSRRITTYLLRAAGYLCLPVDHADDAIAAVETFKPDVVLYDWSTRSGDGIGLSRRMRDAARRHERDLYVIVASALDEPSDFRGREAVDVYFTKPIVAREIQDMLRTRFRAASRR